jgi:DNA-binding winged helix-turn-helix (wHTH) protein/tetratricopeptide (TPR) repeat protein
MKLGFKCSLTKKCLLHINLRADFNWGLALAAVLPSSDLGKCMPGLGPKEIRYRFGPFELNTGEEALARNGTRVRVQDLPYRLLVMLLERPGEIITREEVRQRLWPENTFVEFDNSLGVAIRKVRDALNDDAEAPRYVETVPRRGYRFVAPVTVLGSENSTQTERPSEVPNAEPHAKVTLPRVSDVAVVEPANPGRRSRYWAAIVSVILIMVGAAVYSLRSLPKRVSTVASPVGPAQSVRTRRSVAVLGFRNLPGHAEDNWLSPAFSEMLNTELASDGALRMVPGEDVARVKRELPLPDEDSLAKTTLERLRTNPGADVVVLGSYTALPGNGDKRIRLDIRVQDTLRGETIAEKSFTGSEGNLFELASQAGQALRQSLGISPASNEASLQARAALPSNQEAVRFYAEGQERLWAFDYGHARDLLTKAVAADPGYPLAHAALADAWTHLGYALKARAEIERARSLSEHLGPEDRLLIDGQYYATFQDRTRAIDAYRQLFAQFPDNLDYGLRLADEQRWSNPEDALHTLEVLRHLPLPSGDDPRIDYIEARAWSYKDVIKARAAARRTVEKGTAQGSRLLVARAYAVLCGIGGEDSTVQTCENARKSYTAVGDRDNAARAANDLAAFYYQRGDLDRAEAMFQDAIKVFRQVGDLEGITSVSGNLGDIALARGNLSDAARALSDAIPGYKEMGDKDGVALTLADLAEVEQRRGELKKALIGYQEARTVAQQIDDKRAVGYALVGAGDVFVDQGDLQAARQSYQQSLALRKEIGDKQAVAETELALARLSIEEGHAADAETVIRKCIEQFHQDGQADDELAASVTLIQALLGQNKFVEADKEKQASQALAAKSTNLLNRLQFDLVSARTELASGHTESSRAQLERTLQSAQAHHLLGVELETRLTLAELKNKLGQSAGAHADLVAVEKVAHERGFGLIASKAQSVRNDDEKRSQ